MPRPHRPLSFAGSSAHPGEVEEFGVHLARLHHAQAAVEYDRVQDAAQGLGDLVGLKVDGRKLHNLAVAHAMVELGVGGATPGAMAALRSLVRTMDGKSLGGGDQNWNAALRPNFDEQNRQNGVWQITWQL